MQFRKRQALAAQEREEFLRELSLPVIVGVRLVVGLTNDELFRETIQEVFVDGVDAVIEGSDDGPALKNSRGRRGFRRN